MNDWNWIMRLDGRKKLICGALMLTALLTALVVAWAATPQKADKAAPVQQRTMALGEDEVKRLLMMMDTNKNGRISKQEFLAFMSAEFDRLDTDKSGELDVKELRLSQVRPSRPAPVGK